jgi:acyl transferase domain-containing protein
MPNEGELPSITVNGVRPNGHMSNGSHPVINGSHPVINGSDADRQHYKNGHASNGVASPTQEHPRLLVWSGADQKSAERVTLDYREYYKTKILGNPSSLNDLAITLSQRRSHMPWRSYALAGHEPHSRDGAFSATKPIRSSPKPKLAFVFTGQGAQYAHMGLGLLRYPVFKETLKQVDAAYRDFGCTWSVFGKFMGRTPCSLYFLIKL